MIKYVSFHDQDKRILVRGTQNALGIFLLQDLRFLTLGGVMVEAAFLTYTKTVSPSEDNIIL